MKLGKLLAAGKSIMNGRADVSYRSSKQIYLPKFGSSKNPFKNESPAQIEPGVSLGGGATARSAENCRDSVLSQDESAGPIGTPEPAQFAAGPVSRAKAKVFKPASVQPISESVVRPGVSVVRCSEAAVEKSTAGFAPRVLPPAEKKEAKDWGKFNPISIIRAALPSGKSGHLDDMAKGQRVTPTQTELSLDSVKVVHNDLSDVDVEIVPIKSRASTSELPAPKKSWEFVGERLFGVEAT